MVLNLHSEYRNLTSANTNGKPDMLTRKVLNEKFMQWKKYLTSIKEKIYDKNISYRAQFYLDLIKRYFDIMQKKWYNENIFHWTQIYFHWMKIYFDIIWIFIFPTFQQPYSILKSSLDFKIMLRFQNTASIMITEMLEY